MVSLSAGLEYFDLNFRGMPGVIACAMLHGAEGVALIDPGPSTTIPALRAALEARGVGARDVRALLVTHIHLDHAGASGVLMDLFPDALLHVHRVGAPHMIDPSKLLRSAARLYGDEMDALWGEVRPVPADRVRVLDTGPSPGDPVLRLQAVGHDLEVAYTPGHASHHVSFFHPASRIAFVGDTAGLCRQSGRLVIPATPPPDIDLSVWRESTRRILAWEPGTLFLTHFGPHRSPRVHMQDLWTRIDVWTRLVEASAAWPGTDADRAREFAARVADDITRATDRAEADGYQRAGRFDFSWQGLRRYLGREELRK